MKTITIGRSSHCDIIVPNEGISRVHAEISLVGNQYVYKDVSKNGSSIAGRMIRNERIALAPGANVLLAGRVPLPWAQIYTLLPMHGAQPYDCSTQVYESGETRIDSVGYDRPDRSVYPKDELTIGWGILSFLIPLVGWILYFNWKSETPRRASQAATWAWAGFGTGLLIRFISLA